jgi:hypothetical protein
MAYSSYKIKEIVDHAVSHAWSVPEFQRGFVWKATQVRDLAESLWLKYPVGSVLIWDSGTHKTAIEPKSVTDAKAPSLWLVDGQQRTTALCLLMGRKPYWWSNGQEWNNLVARYDVRFDIDAKAAPYFLIANAALRKTKVNRYVKISKLLGFDLDNDNHQDELQALAKEIKSDGLCNGMDAMEVKTRLERVCRIRGREIIVITVDHDLEEVVEIFARLNSTGTRVKEADIYLGVVAARAPGWVRQHFMPFLANLEALGFAVSPNLLFTSLTAVGAKRVRFKQVEDGFWNSDRIAPAWEKTKGAWHKVVKFMESFGILTNELLPSDAVFVTLAALIAKFHDIEGNRTLFWMLQALRYGRYSSSSTSSLEEDLKEIEGASSNAEAVAGMLSRIRAIEPMTKEEFLRDYGDARFGRLLLYLLVFHKQAVDWGKGSKERIAFKESNLVPGFQPQFHHIFPRKFLEGKAAPEQIEALANIAIIGAETNIRISNKDPLRYFVEYEIGPAKRDQQLISGDVGQMTPENFPTWLDARAQSLSEEANIFMGMSADNQIGSSLGFAGVAVEV